MGMAQPSWGQSLNLLIGQRLQRARRIASPKPLTQQELADRTQDALSRSSIASIERGLQGIALAQLYALAKALNIEPSELLPARNEVFSAPKPGVEELVRTSSPEVATFLRKVQGSAIRKGGARAER